MSTIWEKTILKKCLWIPLSSLVVPWVADFALVVVVGEESVDVCGPGAVAVDKVGVPLLVLVEQDDGRVDGVVGLGGADPHPGGRPDQARSADPLRGPFLLISGRKRLKFTFLKKNRKI